jgi:hypothetical protein
MVTMKRVKVTWAVSSRSQCFYYEEMMSEETDSDSNPCMKTGKLSISPGLSLQKERLFSLHFILRRAIWEKHGGTNRKMHRGKFYYCSYRLSRLQWSRGLRLKPSLPTRTLRSWVRIPLKAWMSVCLYSLFVLLEVAALRRSDPPSKESYRLYID